MTAAAQPIEIRPPEPDLIDRIAAALPEQVRAEYYQELRHCRALPESDEMLRLLRAMQFLVLLIEQAPTRVAEERERLDKLLSTAIENVRKISAASETYHASLNRKLSRLPGDIADGISPEAVADRINENLRQEFVRSTIPQTADSLKVVSDRLKSVCSEFATTADDLGHSYRGAAEDARSAIASMKTEITQAADSATRLTRELSQTYARANLWLMVMIVVGALILGLGVGMTFEQWLLSGQEPAAQSSSQSQPAAPVSEPETPPAARRK